VATATIKKWAKSSNWAEIEYVTDNEIQRLHLAPKFYQKDCVPEKIEQNRHTFWHCGWAVYRKGAADIGEDWQALFAAARKAAIANKKGEDPIASEKAAMAASVHAITAAIFPGRGQNKTHNPSFFKAHRHIFALEKVYPDCRSLRQLGYTFSMLQPATIWVQFFDVGYRIHVLWNHNCEWDHGGIINLQWNQGGITESASKV
jgi:hypothetical protein